MTPFGYKKEKSTYLITFKGESFGDTTFKSEENIDLIVKLLNLSYQVGYVDGLPPEDWID